MDCGLWRKGRWQDLIQNSLPDPQSHQLCETAHCWTALENEVGGLGRRQWTLWVAPLFPLGELCIQENFALLSPFPGWSVCCRRLFTAWCIRHNKSAGSGEDQSGCQFPSGEGSWLLATSYASSPLNFSAFVHGVLFLNYPWCRRASCQA